MAQIPVGVYPTDVWNKKVKTERANDLIEAINRYLRENIPIPKEWPIELQQIFIELYSKEEKTISWEWIRKMRKELIDIERVSE